MRRPRGKLRIIVCGLVGQYPLGGVAWDYLQYLIGLHQLGHEVYYHEDTWCWPTDPRVGWPVEEAAYSVDFLRAFFEQHAPELAGRWHYVHLHEQHFGMSRAAFETVAASADLFLNVSGASFIPDRLSPRCARIFVDTDPGYNQIVMHERPAWSPNVERWIAGVRAHDRHFTYGENIGAADCAIPTVGIDWITTRPVVVMPAWADVRDNAPPADAPFTTVMSWTYFGGPLVHEGVTYDAKASEYERFHELPKRAAEVPLALAVGGLRQDAERIKADGWRWIDGAAISRTPADYQRFIAASAGEWSVAKQVYVATNSGWFSCRTACYLASARPAVVQETGWSRHLPGGEGVIAFGTMDEAKAGLCEVRGRYAHHRAQAYGFAREYLAADRVLPAMLASIP